MEFRKIVMMTLYARQQKRGNTALFTIARTWKQPRCPSADEWIRKLGYIYSMDYYLAI